MEKTLYELLEISRNAGPATVEAAYQLLLSKHDPNLAGNIGREDAAVQLALIKEAYHTLSNPERRAAYDASLRLGSLANLYMPDPARSGTSKLSSSPGRVIGLVAALALIAFIAQYAAQHFLFKHAQDMQADQQIQAAQRVRDAEMRMENGTPEEQAEWEKGRPERERLAQEQDQKYELERQRSEQERIRRDADYNQQQVDSALENARREAEAKRQAEEERLREQKEADEQRILAEKQARENKLRELEERRLRGQ